MTHAIKVMTAVVLLALANQANAGDRNNQHRDPRHNNQHGNQQHSNVQPIANAGAAANINANPIAQNANHINVNPTAQNTNNTRNDLTAVNHMSTSNTTDTNVHNSNANNTNSNANSDSNSNANTQSQNNNEGDTIKSLALALPSLMTAPQLAIPLDCTLSQSTGIAVGWGLVNFTRADSFPNYVCEERKSIQFLQSSCKFKTAAIKTMWLNQVIADKLQTSNTSYQAMLAKYNVDPIALETDYAIDPNTGRCIVPVVAAPVVAAPVVAAPVVAAPVVAAPVVAAPVITDIQ
jgi:hypothetical protein